MYEEENKGATCIGKDPGGHITCRGAGGSREHLSVCDPSGGSSLLFRERRRRERSIYLRKSFFFFRRRKNPGGWRKEEKRRRRRNPLPLPPPPDSEEFEWLLSAFLFFFPVRTRSRGVFSLLLFSRGGPRPNQFSGSGWSVSQGSGAGIFVCVHPT